MPCKNVVTKHCVVFEYQSPKGCRKETFNGPLREFATAEAAGRLANGRILRFIPMVTAHTADRRALYAGVEKCSHRLQGRAHNSEAIP